MSNLASFLVTFFSSLDTLLAGLFVPNYLADTETLGCFVFSGFGSDLLATGFGNAYFLVDATDEDVVFTSFLG